MEELGAQVQLRREQSSGWGCGCAGGGRVGVSPSQNTFLLILLPGSSRGRRSAGPRHKRSGMSLMPVYKDICHPDWGTRGEGRAGGARGGRRPRAEPGLGGAGRMVMRMIMMLMMMVAIIWRHRLGLTRAPERPSGLLGGTGGLGAPREGLELLGNIWSS